jgi:subtilisin family serine protease
MPIVTTSTTIRTATGTVIDIFQNGVKVIESIYDAKSKLQTYTEYASSGAVKAVSTYTYNALGLTDKKTVTDASGKVTDVWTYSYNAKKQVDHIDHLNGQVDYYVNGVFDHTNTTKIVVQDSAWDTTFGYGQIDLIKAFAVAGINIKDTAPTVKTDWNMLTSHFDDAWSAGYTGKGIVIAVIDSGIDLKNVELTQHLSNYSWNFIANNTNVQDEFGHGSFTASLLNAMKDGDLVTGGAYDAELMVLKVSDAKGIGSVDNVTKAVYYAVDHGADIINLSMNSVFAQPKLEAAFKYANDHDVLISVSSGNSLGKTPNCPASYAKTCDNVVAVGATMQVANKVDNFAAFSNKAGSNTAFNYVDAAGVAVSGFDATGKIVTMNGTSMAAPMVAAEMAILKQYLEETHSYSNSVIDEMVMNYVCQGTTDIGLIGIHPLVI